MDAWRLNPLAIRLGTCPECRCTQRVVVLMDGPEASCDMCGWSGLRLRMWRWLVRPLWTISYLRWQRHKKQEAAEWPI